MLKTSKKTQNIKSLAEIIKMAEELEKEVKNLNPAVNNLLLSVLKGL